jgi:hypothetical protein
MHDLAARDFHRIQYDCKIPRLLCLVITGGLVSKPAWLARCLILYEKRKHHLPKNRTNVRLLWKSKVMAKSYLLSRRGMAFKKWFINLTRNMRSRTYPIEHVHWSSSNLLLGGCKRYKYRLNYINGVTYIQWCMKIIKSG